MGNDTKRGNTKGIEKPQSKISRKVMSKIYRDLMIMSVTILENKSVIVYNIKWN